jgi:acyl-CoA thioesterase FadM
VSGFLRNLITALLACLRYASAAPLSQVVCKFWVTPFDTGIAKLKSDGYLQLAEAAQFDYMIKTGLIGNTLKQGYAFVNAAQMVQFNQPIGMFSRVTVRTQVVFADDKWVYFAHDLQVHGTHCARVLVKMKFKQGRITVVPSALLGVCNMSKPTYIEAWDAALSSIL